MNQRQKDLKKEKLEIEKQRKIKELEQKYSENGLISSGEFINVRANLERQYDIEKELVDEEVTLPEERASSKLITRKPPLFKNISRYKELINLEKLFHGEEKATYATIAMKIGFIKKISTYKKDKKRIKSHILLIKRTFNKYSKNSWGQVLQASRDGIFDGLYLTSVN